MSKSLGRITRPEEFSNIRKNGSRATNGGIVVIHCVSRDGPRLGFAVGRAVGNAVQRNRFRRVVREFLRHKKLPAADLVVLLRTPVQKMTNNDVRNALTTILQKNGWPT